MTRRLVRSTPESPAAEPVLEYAVFIDRSGRWRINQAVVTHQGMLAFLKRSLESRNGCLELRINNQRVPVIAEGAPLTVLNVRARDDAYLLEVDDGRNEQLQPETLRLEAADTLICVLSDGLEARFSRQAYTRFLLEFLDEERFARLEATADPATGAVPALF